MNVSSALEFMTYCLMIPNPVRRIVRLRMELGAHGLYGQIVLNLVERLEEKLLEHVRVMEY